MAKFYWCISLVLVACSAVLVQGDAELEAAWKEFQAQHPLKLKTTDEADKAKLNFADTHARILAHNNNKKSTYEMKHNIFSVMDDEEMKQYMGAFSPKVPIGATNYLAPKDFAVRVLPTTVDYRTHKCMQPIKSQGACGSCWAFSATAVVEFGKCVINGTKVALSEQQLVDCSTASNGCRGGYFDEAWKYLADAGGQASSSSYPYKAAKGACKAANIAKVATVSKSSPVTEIAPKDTNTMMTLLANQRIFTVGIAIVSSFKSYKSGVYTEANCKSKIIGYHAIVVVGYGTLKGLDYWVIRNSWGTGWGNAGYALFQRGKNLCMIEDYASSTTVIG